MPLHRTEAAGGFTRLVFTWEARMQRMWYSMEDGSCSSIYNLCCSDHISLAQRLPTSTSKNKNGQHMTPIFPSPYFKIKTMEHE